MMEVKDKAINAETLKNVYDNLDSKITQLKETTTSWKKIKRTYQVGHYSTSGFNDSNTTYARSINVYPAGEYKISKLSSDTVDYSYTAIAYVSDKKGEIIDGVENIKGDIQFKSSRDFYITIYKAKYNNGSDITDSDINFIENNFVVMKNVNSLEDDLNSYIMVKELTLSSVTLSANGGTGISTGNPETINGYTPIAIVGYMTQNSTCLPYICYISMESPYTVQFHMRNLGSSSETSTPKVRVLYIKN